MNAHIYDEAAVDGIIRGRRRMRSEAKRQLRRASRIDLLHHAAAH